MTHDSPTFEAQWLSTLAMNSIGDLKAAIENLDDQLEVRLLIGGEGYRLSCVTDEGNFVAIHLTGYTPGTKH